MKYFWKFVDVAMSASTPIVVLGITYAAFVSPDHFDPNLVMAGTLYVVFQIIYPAHYQTIGGMGRKTVDSPHVDK